MELSDLDTIDYTYILSSNNFFIKIILIFSTNNSIYLNYIISSITNFSNNIKLIKIEN
jgi:hypothetical protein